MNATSDSARAAAPAATSPALASLFGLPDEPPHERVLLVTDPATQLKAILAVHSTARGPAFGGCRFWHYASDTAALTDALRLAQGMSLKNAMADLPFGGGKAVILKPAGWRDDPAEREALFAAFGRAVQSLGGAYITAEDVGTTTADMRVVQRQTPYVSGIPREGAFGGDPSPKTAWGVFVAIEAGVQRQLQRSSLADVRVAIQGLGAVGMHLAQFLHDAGARLLVADVNQARVEEAQARFGAEALPVDRILAAECDVLAPCALGAVLNTQTVPAVRAKIVAGAANNQLATAADGDALNARGVLYLPDYLVNAGGIISVAREYLSAPGCGMPQPPSERAGTGLGSGPAPGARNEVEEKAVMAEVGRIRERVLALLDRVAASGETPARAADAWARSKLV